MDETARRRALAERLAGIYEEHTRPRAILLAGSSGTRGVDLRPAASA